MKRLFLLLASLPGVLSERLAESEPGWEGLAHTLMELLRVFWTVAATWWHQPLFEFPRRQLLHELAPPVIPAAVTTIMTAAHGAWWLLLKGPLLPVGAAVTQLTRNLLRNRASAAAAHVLVNQVPHAAPMPWRIAWFFITTVLTLIGPPAAKALQKIHASGQKRQTNANPGEIPTLLEAPPLTPLEGSSMDAWQDALRALLPSMIPCLLALVLGYAIGRARGWTKARPDVQGSPDAKVPLYTPETDETRMELDAEAARDLALRLRFTATPPATAVVESPATDEAPRTRSIAPVTTPMDSPRRHLDLEEEEEVVFDLWAPLSSSPRPKRTGSFAKRTAAEKAAAEEALVASMKAAMKRTAAQKAGAEEALVASMKTAMKRAAAEKAGAEEALVASMKAAAAAKKSEASPKHLAMQWLGHAVLMGRKEDEDEEEEELTSSPNPKPPSGPRPPSPPPSAGGDTPDTQMRQGWIYASPAARMPIDARDTARASPSSSEFRPPLPSAFGRETLGRETFPSPGDWEINPEIGKAMSLVFVEAPMALFKSSAELIDGISAPKRVRFQLPSDDTQPATLFDLIEPREELSKAKEAGLSCAEARAAGYSCADARAVGYDLIDAKAAGWTTEELLNAGYINQALAMRLDATNAEEAADKDDDDNVEFDLFDKNAAEKAAADALCAAVEMAAAEANAAAENAAAEAKAATEAKAAAEANIVDGYKKVREYIDRRSAREREVLATALKLVLAPAAKAAVDKKAADEKAAAEKAGKAVAEKAGKAAKATEDEKAADEKAGAAAKSEFIEDRAALAKAKEAGLSCAEARAAGYSCADARAVGYDLMDAKAAGWTTEELLNAGYINKALAMRLDAASSEAAKI